MIVNTRNILPKVILNIFLNFLLYEALKMNEYLSHTIKEEDCKIDANFYLVKKDQLWSLVTENTNKIFTTQNNRHKMMNK